MTSDLRASNPSLIARLQLSALDIAWACSQVDHRQHERIDGEWSPHQQVFHLLATEEQDYHARIRRILEEDTPVLVRWDNEAHMRETYTTATPVMRLAEHFAAARTHTVEVLDALTIEQVRRKGVWPDGRTIDLAWLAEKALWHGLDHLACLLDLHGEMEPLQALPG